VPFPPSDQGWFATALREATAVPAKFLGVQLTGGSNSVHDGFYKMRAAGAVARLALVQAAARRLGLDPATLKTENGAVIAPDGTRLPYSDLAADAASADLPATPELRPQSEWKILGKGLPRLDVAAKSTGTTTYAGDIRLPGTLFATVKRNPAQGAPMRSYDDSAARTLPGVKKIIAFEDGVAVIATTTWSAFQGAEAITFDWAPAIHAASSAEMRAEIAAAFTQDQHDATPRAEGNLSFSGTMLEAEYLVPHLAHATMEPMQATALLQDGKLQLWIGTQTPGFAQSHAAAAIGLPPEAVEVHTLPMGGAFGRRAEIDVAVQAARIAQAMPGTPIVLTWSREEDMTHDMYRPMALARLKASVKDGAVESFDLAIAAPSTMDSFAKRFAIPLMGPDATLTQGAWEQPYAFPAYHVTAYRAPPSVPLGFWRSVGASHNAFFHESAVDELAHLAGADPLDFRLKHMTDPRSRAVLETVAKLANWGSPRKGRALGVAFATAFSVPTAEIIEVAQTPEGIRLTGAWAATDVGIALDPQNIQAQISGAMVFGLSAAIRGEITFANHAAEQQNFWDYKPLRLSQVPDIKVVVLATGEVIHGAGEPGTPPAAPALANALYALTGTRARSLPLNKTFSFA
jgi:isoquinoline 1-oxidoreductase subunit beta